MSSRDQPNGSSGSRWWRSGLAWAAIGSVATVVGVIVALAAWWFPRSAAEPDSVGPGGVTTSNPGPSQSPSSSPVSAVTLPSGVPDTSSPAEERSWYFLADRPWLPESNAPGSSATGPAQTNGVSYPHSVVQDHWAFSGESTILFDLQRKCRTFTFTLGVSDNSPDVGPNVAEVYADNKQLARFAPRLTRSDPGKLNVAGALRLKLVFNGPDSRVSLVWGDAKIECSPLSGM
jgi:NPCBM/NEW2 domain